MNNYNRSGRSGNGKAGRRRFYGDKSSRSRSGGYESQKMYQVVCDNCGKDCKVPFKPNTDKPVYCDECFKNKDNGRNYKNLDKRGCSSDGCKYEELDQKLDRIIMILDSIKDNLK